MKKSSILSIPIAYQQQIHQIEVFPFDTPLQIAYRFCTQQHLEFNFISPLSKQIITYVQMVLDSQSVDQSIKMQIQLHFDKFINNATIRESIKIADQSIRISNNCIQIGEQSHDEKFDFSFDHKEEVVDQFQFSFKNKLQDLLNPQPSSRAENYVKNNTVQQIENLQKQEKMNQKIINRLQNKSQRGMPYSEYMSFHSTRRGSSNIQQSPIQSPEKQEQNTIQTLPKVSFENQHNLSPQEISFSQQQIDQNQVQIFHYQSMTLCNNSRIERSTKQDRMKSFKELMNKLQSISTPQKRNYEIMIKQQNNTIGKTEQKINEVFVLLDSDKDGYIDHGVNLQQLKEHIIELFEPIWFQILWKKVKVNKRQFQEMMQKRYQYSYLRIKDLDQQELGKFIFNGIKK